MNAKYLAISAAILGLAVPVLAQEQAQNLGNMSIDDLMKIEVTSASKHSQPLDSAPAAITVITQDDMHRMGARTLVEALRLVPGLQIGRYTQNYYAVTVRGFNAPNFDTSNGNKLLVLMDGRSLYKPYASSTYWEVEDTLLENVDRIEVIKGPGGSLYGANAINGVINIITKSATQTEGGLVVASAGSLEKDRLSLQYGFKPKDNLSVRFFGKHGSDGTAQNPDGTSFGDSKVVNELGFRGDMESTHGSFMLQGTYNRFNITENVIAPLLTDPFSRNATPTDTILDSDIVARWTKDEASGAQSRAQVYYDRQAYPYTNGTNLSNAWDFDFQRQFAPKKSGNIILGGGYRSMINDSVPGETQFLTPTTRRDSIFNFFGQDQIQVSEKGNLTLGFKLEHNTYTGYEFQPSIRYLNRVDDTHTWWGAISRAVRTPSQTELSDNVLTTVDAPATPSDLPTAHVSYGNPNMRSEHLLAYELGYRFRSGERYSIELSSFYDVYSDLIYASAGNPTTGTYLGVPVNLIPTTLQNGEKGNVYGAELQGRWKLSDNTFANTGLSYIRQTPFSQGTSIVSPMYQAFMRLSHDFKSNLKGDLLYYWYDAVPDVSQPSYSKLDLHLSYRLNANSEISFGGQDLLVPRSIQSFGGQYIPRSVYLQVNSHF